MMQVSLVQIGHSVSELGDSMFQRKTKGFGMMKQRNMTVEVLKRGIPLLRYS